MKTIKNKINDLILENLLKGENTEQEYEIFSSIFDFYLQEENKSTAFDTEEIANKLYLASCTRREEKEKLNHIEKLNYFGEYVHFYLNIHEITYVELAQNVKIENSILHNLIANKIKIFDINPSILARLIKYLNLKLETIKELLIKTILLNYGKVSAKNSLARYSKLKGLEDKGKSMGSAVNELLLKAHKAKPLNMIDQDLEKKTESYLNELRKELNEYN